MTLILPVQGPSLKGEDVKHVGHHKDEGELVTSTCSPTWMPFSERQGIPMTRGRCGQGPQEGSRKG